jgi:Domain of unknown function (DUF6817)
VALASPGLIAGTVRPVSTPAELAPVTGERLQMLKSLGYSDLMHDSGVPFLSHLIGTRRVLVEWGSRPALCDAGLFHSVYGTEYFQPAQAASREQVQAVIGAEAERVAWLWCNIERDTLDIRRRSVRLRSTHSAEALSDTEVSDIATLWSADTVEQIGRMSVDERAFARGVLRVVAVACEPAQHAIEGVAPLLPRAGWREHIRLRERLNLR